MIFCDSLPGRSCRTWSMIFTAASLRQTNPMMKAMMSMVIAKNKIPDLIIQEGKSCRMSTAIVMVSTERLSSTLSTTIVPNADDIFIELFFEIRKGLASSPILAGIATMARKPTLVTEKRVS